MEIHTAYVVNECFFIADLKLSKMFLIFTCIGMPFYRRVPDMALGLEEGFSSRVKHRAVTSEIRNVAIYVKTINVI